MSLLGLAVVTAALASMWVEEGEVATLVTFDAQDRPLVSRLWIVDVAGDAYVRAPNPGARWLRRLRSQPIVHLSRGNGIVSVRGVPQPDASVRERVNTAMVRKYGRLERALVWLRDPSRSVPVRLDPVPSASR